eukprot:TRINITY_DN11158_c0_g1_i1.p1 TRINITY_DN11158_c0_g1~~TRINITY_DN11158_c0_g1_i1.p1  ORF type:complete len:711 (+),score=171.76 TRINITY_DN11158_c0_g1_i1:13-2145(+)
MKKSMGRRRRGRKKDILAIFGERDLDIWSCLVALQKYSNSRDVQQLICNKLYEFDTSVIEFFIPQLCQLIIYKKKRVHYVSQFILDKCRSSIRFGLLVSFIFQAALDDNNPSTRKFCKIFLSQCESAMVGGSKNDNIAEYIHLFKKNKGKEFQQEDNNYVVSPKIGAVSDKDLENIISDLLGDYDNGEKPMEFSVFNAYDRSTEESVYKLSERVIDLCNMDEVDGDSMEHLLFDIESAYNNIKTIKNNPEDAILGDIEVDHNILDDILLEQSLREEYFARIQQIIKGFEVISSGLVDLSLKTKDLKNNALRRILSMLNNELDYMHTIYIPIILPGGEPVRILRIPPSEGLCLNSRDRVPYMISLEVVFGNYEISHTENEEENIATESSEEVEEIDLGPDISDEEDWFLLDPGEEVPTVLKTAFGETWEERKQTLKKESPLGHVDGWDVVSVIVKGGDDLRQEQLAMQLIQLFHDIFQAKGLFTLWLRPYMVLATSADGGLLETVKDAISIHGLKEKLNIDSLRTYFIQAYGNIDSPEFRKAQTNFVESLAAYALVCYLLQIKDRHNGNILIDREGHIIHIDYGFMLESSPGNLAFESAPFKLPYEFVEVMGGTDTDTFTYFQTLLEFGFLELRKHYREIVCLVEMMLPLTNMPCFVSGPATITNLVDRFQLHLSEEEVGPFIKSLTQDSLGSLRTSAYDHYQYLTNGYRV